MSARTLCLLVVISFAAAPARAQTAPPPSPPLIETQAPPAPAPRDRSQPGDPLYVGGLLVFTGAYLPMTIFGDYAMATNAPWVAGWAQVPVLGPLLLGTQVYWATASSAPSSNSDLANRVGALFIVDGIAQAVGLTLAIIGQVRNHRDTRAHTLALAPGGPGSGLGLTLAGSF